MRTASELAACHSDRQRQRRDLGSRNLSQAEGRAHVSIFEPMDRAIMEAFSSAPRQAAFSVHSFASRLATPIGPGMRAF